MVVWIQNPFDNLPGEGFRKMRYALMAEAFARAGHDVTVWTSDFSHSRKSRRAIVGSAFAPPVACRFVPTPAYSRNVSLKRVVSHLVYARRWGAAARSAYAAGERPDLLVTSFPTISAAGAVLDFGRRVGCRVVVDVQDAWPETFERILPRWTLAPLRREARRLFRGADLVTGVCDRYRDLVSRTDYFRAYLGIETSSARPSRRVAPSRGVRIAYIGGMGRTYDLETARRAAQILGAELCVAGGSNPLGREALEDFLSRCDVGLVPMDDSAWVGIPNKMFDYAKAGLPVVSSLGGESAALIEKYGCGAIFRAGDPESLAAAVRAALECSAGASLRMCECEFDAVRIYDGYVDAVTRALRNKMV